MAISEDQAFNQELPKWKAKRMKISSLQIEEKKEADLRSKQKLFGESNVNMEKPSGE